MKRFLVILLLATGLSSQTAYADTVYYSNILYPTSICNNVLKDNSMDLIANDNKYISEVKVVKNLEKQGVLPNQINDIMLTLRGQTLRELQSVKAVFRILVFFVIAIIFLKKI